MAAALPNDTGVTNLLITDPVIIMLTVKEPTTPDLWRAWLPEGKKILVNSKKWVPDPGDTVFELIKGNVTDTGWGDSSLVQAHQALLTAGLIKYKFASHYVLVSGDTAPIASYADFRSFMLRRAGTTLMDEYESQKDTIRLVLNDAKDKGIELGWWLNLTDKKLEIPAVAQWTAIANDAAKFLVSHKPSMTAIAIEYQNIITKLYDKESKIVAADEVVPSAMLLWHNVEFESNPFKVNLKDMSPVWVAQHTLRAEKGKHGAFCSYQEAVKKHGQNTRWLFARKILNLSRYESETLVKDKGIVSEAIPWKPKAAVIFNVATKRKATAMPETTPKSKQQKVVDTGTNPNPYATQKGWIVSSAHGKGGKG